MLGSCPGESNSTHEGSLLSSMERLPDADNQDSSGTFQSDERFKELVQNTCSTCYQYLLHNDLGLNSMFEFQSQGYNPLLHVSVQHDHLNILEFLHSKGVSMDSNDPETGFTLPHTVVSE